MNELLILAGLIIAATVGLPFLCKRRWALILWAPVVIADSLVLYQIFGNLPHGAAGPDAGFVGMEVEFHLLFSLPVILITIISLFISGFAFPRRIAWNLTGGIGGVINSFVTVFTLIELHTPSKTITVTYEDGRAAPNVVVEFSASEFGSSRSLGTEIADKDGQVTIHLPSRELVSGC